ncbi:MAG: hypothetical protein COA79_01735 [Planctomycetota bacterium]|nr:MAG: hypothetical protein COA79_01735 [Planctomycetota bacterium]
MKKNYFSLIELLAVIVVILILMTLFVPSLSNVRKKARTAICANDLKQLGTLIGTYANDHDGRLPYTNNNTSRWVKEQKPSYLDRRGVGRLYGSWAGHLIPYLNINLKSWDHGNWTYDNARSTGNLVYKLTWTFQSNLDDIDKRTDRWGTSKNLVNWQLMHDMFFEGGHGALKIFICPDAPRTFTHKYYEDGIRVPRVSGLIPPKSGFLKGLPSSYLCNGPLFNGSDNLNSKRLEDAFSNNYLLLEGVDQYSEKINGMATPNAYSFFFSYMSWTNGFQGWTGSRYDMAASFMHDNTEEVWFSDSRGYNGAGRFADGQRYNKVFSPNSIASIRWSQFERHHHKLVSNQYPGQDWENFEMPWTKNKFSVSRYYSSDTSVSYTYGNMNMLNADFSVKKTHVGWLFENARTLTQVNE